MLSISDLGDGGEVNVSNNDLEIANSIFTQIYLTLFGGNLSSEEQWFGNLYSDNKLENQFTTNIEELLDNTIIRSGELSNFKAELDKILQKVIQTGIADTIETTIQIVDIKKINIIITATYENTTGVFALLYDKSKNNVIINKKVI